MHNFVDISSLMDPMDSVSPRQNGNGSTVLPTEG